MQNLVQRQSGMTGWLFSTIGRKQLVAVTGLGLSVFVLVHMLGNMLILAGPQAYNEYAHKLVSNPLIYVAEAGLVGIFLVHLFLALRVTLLNYAARDSRYAVMSSGAKRTEWTQRTMWAQGLLIAVFVILHLITFKYGNYYSVNYGQGEIRDLHRLVIEVFKEPGYVAWYIVALIALGFHLKHGVASALQSIGVHHPRYRCLIKMLGVGYALVVALGFISQPIYVYFFN